MYNYVVFNNVDGGFWLANADGYYSICMQDLQGLDDVRVVGSPVDYKSKLVRFFYRIHTSAFTNKIISFPFKDKWYPLYFNDKFENTKPLCFILIANPPLDYLRYLKNKYPDAKFVKFYRDLVHTQLKYYDSYVKSHIIDYWVTYDEIEAKKYGMYYYHEIESKIELDSNNEIYYDVFFAGRAKKRLPRLIEAYDYLSSKGLKCYFYLTGVSNRDRIPRSGINYSNKLMSYKQMLLHNSHAKCLLEINQENAVGYTARFLEAVMYDKKLITDNLNIKNSEYYKYGFIQCFTNIQDINISFVKDNTKVDYNYQNDFSPRGFIDYLKTIVK